MSDLDKFFLEDLPAAFAATKASLVAAADEAAEQGNQQKADKLRAKLAEAEQVSATMRFQVTGDGGGDYYLNAADGDLTVDSEGNDSPVVWISQRMVDFNALKEAGINPVAAATGGGGSAKVPIGAFRAELLDQLRAMDSVIKIVLTGLPESDHEAETTIRLGLATRDDADMTMRLSFDTLTQMRTGALPPPAAFMTGQLLIEGDMSIAMQLAGMAMG